MAAEILPELSMAMFNALRTAWEDTVAEGTPIPSLQYEGGSSCDAENLERLYLSRVAGNPGSAVVRALGGQPDYKPGSTTIANARAATQLKAHTRGMRAIMRMVVTGKDHGAADLDRLVAGGALNPALSEVFDDAVKTLVQVQFDLPVTRNNRVRIDGRPVVSRSSDLDLSGPFRSLS